MAFVTEKGAMLIMRRKRRITERIELLTEKKKTKKKIRTYGEKGAFRYLRILEEGMKEKNLKVFQENE